MIHAALWIVSLVIVVVAALVVLWCLWWVGGRIVDLLGMLVYGVCLAVCGVVSGVGCVVMWPWNAAVEVGRRIRRWRTRGRMATLTPP